MAPEHELAKIFDRRCVRNRRDRAANGAPEAFFMVREIAARLAERLHEVVQMLMTCIRANCPKCSNP